MAAKNPVSKRALIESVVKGGTSIMYRHVGQFDLLQDGEVHVRPSTTREGRIYFRAPLAWSNGVYLTGVNARYLKEMLDEAIELADKIQKAPTVQQKIVVTSEGGSEVELPIPAGFKVSTFRLV